MGKEDFSPRILGFLCNWCSYAGADLAGVSRFQYPPNIRVIRVMCSARVDPTHVLEAFISGLDGVMVLGCHPGDCHYMSGNYQTERRMKLTQRILESLGMDPDRLLTDWVSASEGERFATLVGNFVEKVRDIGPFGSETDIEDLKTRLTAAKDALADDRLRWLVGREKELVEQGNVFGEKLTQEEFDRVMLESIENEYARSQILTTLGEDALTIWELAKRTNRAPRDILKNLVSLEQERLVSVDRLEGNSPVYARVGR